MCLNLLGEWVCAADDLKVGLWETDLVMKASGKSYSDLVIFSLSIFEVSIKSLIQGLRVIMYCSSIS